MSMNSSAQQQTQREIVRVQANREELVERMARTVREDGTVEPLKGILLHRSSSPTELHPRVAEPVFAVIAQGSKELYLGDERYRYDPYHYCLSTVELPVSSQIIEASPERPYLGYLPFSILLAKSIESRSEGK